MLEETGTIVELKGKHLATVLCEKSSFCRNCAAMESCQVGDDNRSKLVDAHNLLGGQVGDRVRLATPSRTFLQSSFILYVVPLIALLAGAVLGQVLGDRLMTGLDPNLLSAMFGMGFLVGAFLVIRVATRALAADTYRPRIVEILPEDEVFAASLKHGN